MRGCVLISQFTPEADRQQMLHKCYFPFPFLLSILSLKQCLLQVFLQQAILAVFDLMKLTERNGLGKMHTVIHVTYIKNTKLCYGDFQIPCEKTAVASSIHVAYHLNEMPVFLASPISSVCILMGREPMNQMYQCIWDQFLIFQSKIMIQTKQHTEINTRRHSRREMLWYKHVHLLHDKYHLSKLCSKIKYIKMKLDTQQTLKILQLCVCLFIFIISNCITF